MVEKISLRETPVIDAHCFTYENVAVTAEQLGGGYAMVATAAPYLDRAERDRVACAQGSSTAAFRHRIKDLAGFLSCDTTAQAVVEAREARRKADFQGYVKDLMDDARIRGLLLDNGLQTLADVDEFGARFPGFYHKILRLTTLERDLLESSHTFDNLVADFDRTMEEAVRKHGCVAFKSIIAYRTGLDIRRVGVAEAEADFNARARQPVWFGYKVKKLRDFLLRRALLNSISLGVPVLVHTGLGDSDIIAKQCRPMLMWDLLKDDQVLPAKVMLVHAGFPYTLEAAYMASMLPNVHLDLSSGSGPAFLEIAMSASRLADLLMSVPLPKLVYSSDGGHPPETLWHDATVAKRGLAGALDRMVALGAYTVDEAMQAGEDILHNNAKTLFVI